MEKNVEKRKEESISEKIKRLSFIKAEDVFFIIYNTLIFLNNLKCTSEKSTFKDWRKLIFIIYLVNDRRSIEILKECKQGIKNDHFTRELKRIYLEGAQNKNLVKHILLLLEKKKLICLVEGKVELDIYLLENDEVKEFIKNELFDDEKENIEELRILFPKIRTLLYKTLLEKIFKNNGVEIWEN